MQDRVSLYPGRVKLEPVAGQANLYDLTRADQPTHEGTPLNKASLLKDATAALFGLDATAVPDDALSVLSRIHKGLGNEYVWVRQQSIITTTPFTSTGTILNTYQYTGNLQYSDSVFYNQSTGKIELVNPITASVSSLLSNYSVLYGKYLQLKATGDPKTDNKLVKFDNPFTPVNADKNFLNVNSGGNFVSVSFSLDGYVNSPDPNAYPPAVSDGFTYTALGQLGAKVQIATGSYIGTGKYDTGNKNVISLPFAPKLVIVGKKDYGLTPQSTGGTNGGWLESFLWYIGLEQTRSYRASSNNYGFVYFTNTTSSFTWYSSQTVEMQCNVSGTTYYYIAIG